MFQVGQECQSVCVVTTNDHATADLRNGKNTMTLAAVTESDSLSSSRQTVTSHLKLLPTSGSGIFRNVLEVSDLLYAHKLRHCALN